LREESGVAREESGVAMRLSDFFIFFERRGAHGLRECFLFF
jgi:hypothetical protein